MEPLVDERYRLDTELGSGGTAVVWLAWDTVLDLPRALKLLIPVAGAGAEERRVRLRTEARALASLDHPHVIRVFDQGVHDGRDYIVMEYAEGGSLADRLATEGPMAPGRAVRLVLQVLEALQAAHEAGIVHRDVKPANVLLRTDDHVALSDFGIARVVELGGTRTGVALGAAGFMAPEQRLDARGVGPPADLYATACTLFNLVTNDTPVDLYLAPVHSPRWADVAAPLRVVLQHATQADPADRYQHAGEMRAALEAILGAVDPLPAARRRRLDVADTHVPTASEPMAGGVAGAGGSRKVEPAPRLELASGAPSRVRPEDWRASHGHRPGRTALWLGLALVILVTAAGLAGRPLLDDLQARAGAPETSDEDVDAPPESPAPEGPRVGQWRGNLEGTRPMGLRLESGGGELTGTLELRLGKNERRSTLRGGWDPEGGVLTLSEAGGPATLVARPSGHAGVWTGDLTLPAGGAAVPFAMVWVGPSAD